MNRATITREALAAGDWTNVTWDNVPTERDTVQDFMNAAINALYMACVNNLNDDRKEQ